VPCAPVRSPTSRCDRRPPAHREDCPARVPRRQAVTVDPCSPTQVVVEVRPAVADDQHHGVRRMGLRHHEHRGEDHARAAPRRRHLTSGQQRLERLRIPDPPPVADQWAPSGTGREGRAGTHADQRAVEDLTVRRDLDRDRVAPDTPVVRRVVAVVGARPAALRPLTTVERRAVPHSVDFEGVRDLEQVWRHAFCRRATGVRAVEPGHENARVSHRARRRAGGLSWVSRP